MPRKRPPQDPAVDALMPSNRALALELLLEGHSNTEVAERLNLDRTTVWKWTKDPQFAGELSERRAERRHAAHGLLDAEVPRCIRTLVTIRDDVRAPAIVRVKAAAELLDRAGIGPVQTVEVVQARSDTEIEAWLADRLGIGDEAEGEDDAAEPERTAG